MSQKKPQKRAVNPWENLISYKKRGVIDMREVNALAEKQWPKINDTGGSLPTVDIDQNNYDDYDPNQEIVNEENRELAQQLREAIGGSLVTTEEAQRMLKNIRGDIEDDNMPLSEKLNNLGRARRLLLGE